MTIKQVCSLKKGDWLTINQAIYKIYEISPRGVFLHAHEMIYENGEYIEGDITAFMLGFIHLYGEVYKPGEIYKPDQEENADEEETI